MSHFEVNLRVLTQFSFAPHRLGVLHSLISIHGPFGLGHVYPAPQEHLKLPGVLTQVPIKASAPQRVGFTEHSSTSLHGAVGGLPWYPASQVHEKPPTLLAHFALAPHGFVPAEHSLKSTQPDPYCVLL